MNGRLRGKSMVIGTAVAFICVSLLAACEDPEEATTEPPAVASEVPAGVPGAEVPVAVSFAQDDVVIPLTNTAVISTILLSGQPADLEAFLALPGASELQLEELDSVPSLADREQEASEQFFVRLAVDRPDLAMLMPETRRYAISGPDDDSDNTGPHVNEARRRVYELVEAALREREPGDPSPPLVFADVNTLALADAVVNVDPASNGIVPTGVYPTPVPGGPVDPNKIYGDSTALPEALLGQWALQAGTGINLSDARGARNAAVADILGAGSVVVMFDTLPNALAAGVSSTLAQTSVDLPRWNAATGAASLATTMIARVDPHGSGGYPALPTPTSSDASRKEHGLFTASLIHAVAPSAELHLVRAANDYGQSTVYNLVGALHWYLANEGAVGGNDATGLLSDTVFHLGIGVRYPTDDASVDEANEVATQLASLISTVQALIIDPLTDPSQITRLTAYLNALTATNTDSNSLPALYAPIQLSRELGAVIVASAGNRASGLVESVVDQLPAAYTNTLAVVGTTKDTSFACVSGSLTNTALSKVLAAPAGFMPSGSGTCSPSGKALDVENDKLVGCYNCLPLYILGAVSQGVMIDIHHQPIPPNNPASAHVHNPVVQDRYGYWAGTSWSAAFTSGAAALVRGACPAYSPTQVEAALLDNAAAPVVPNLNLGAGLLDVEATVNYITSPVAPCPQ